MMALMVSKCHRYLKNFRKFISESLKKLDKYPMDILEMLWNEIVNFSGIRDFFQIHQNNH